MRFVDEFRDADLGVLPTQVSYAGRWWLASESGVGPVVIVGVQPAWEGPSAGGFAGVGAGVSPFDEQGSVEPFDAPMFVKQLSGA